ncbi:MAG: hypothetical protein ACRC76_06935 [Proteocatella sp.]
MINSYYVNKNTEGNPNNNHEIHTGRCRWIPSVENRIYLGDFTSCSDAVKKAREYYNNVDGCATCCPDCHNA